MTKSLSCRELAALCEAAEQAIAAGRIMDAAASLNAALALTSAAHDRHARLAACGEAIAQRLETMPALDDAARTLLVVAARTARIHCGLLADWPGIRRAEYLLGKAYLAAGDTDAAARHARQCLSLCEAGDAAQAERHQAAALLARVLGQG